MLYGFNKATFWLLFFIFNIIAAIITCVIIDYFWSAFFFFYFGVKCNYFSTEIHRIIICLFCCLFIIFHSFDFCVVLNIFIFVVLCTCPWFLTCGHHAGNFKAREYALLLSVILNYLSCQHFQQSVSTWTHNNWVYSRYAILLFPIISHIFHSVNILQSNFVSRSSLFSLSRSLSCAL